jgi:hypothetical protein
MSDDILGVTLDGRVIEFREPKRPDVTIRIYDTGQPGVLRWLASHGEYADTGETWSQALYALAGWLIDAEADGRVLR